MFQVELPAAQLAELGKVASEYPRQRFSLESSNMHNGNSVALIAQLGARKGQAWVVTENGRRYEL